MGPLIGLGRIFRTPKIRGYLEKAPYLGEVGKLIFPNGVLIRLGRTPKLFGGLGSSGNPFRNLSGLIIPRMKF